MGIEEAIDILQGIKDGTACLMKDMPKRGEMAIDMAIDALKQSEQPEPHYDEWCDSCKEYDKEKHSCPRWNKVIKNTVEELKSAQPEPCEDAVSRKAVQYLLAHFVDEDKYVDACDGLKHLPPVTPKQRTGKWLWQTGKVKCNQCLRAIRRIDHDGLLNFCPHCGAKMEEEPDYE